MARSDGKVGVCGVTDEIIAARAALHMWEEPCISGDKGSGAVFFSGCNMKCVFCQNYDIAHAGVGRSITVERLSQIFFELCEQGALNINLVTPTHYIPQIAEAIKAARQNGLTVPIIYNSSGYEKVSSLKMLDGLIDVYLPDCKYYSDELAVRYSNAAGYHAVALEAIGEMLRQVGECAFDENGIITKGVIVRHMILPNHTKDSIAVLGSLYERFGNRVYYSIMNQYTPMPRVMDSDDFPELTRAVTKREYAKIIDYALSLGIENGYTQEGAAVSESFIPAFDETGL